MVSGAGELPSGLLEKALFATVVAPFHTSIPPPVPPAELPVTVLLWMFNGPPAKMPPPTNTAVLAWMRELFTVAEAVLDNDSPPPLPKNALGAVEALFEIVDRLIVAVPVSMIPPPLPPVLSETVELLIVAEPSFSIPPPVLLAVLPDTVEAVSVTVPWFSIPPPRP